VGSIYLPVNEVRDLAKIESEDGAANRAGACCKTCRGGVPNTCGRWRRKKSINLRVDSDKSGFFSDGRRSSQTVLLNPCKQRDQFLPKWPSPVRASLRNGNARLEWVTLDRESRLKIKKIFLDFQQGVHDAGNLKGPA